MDHSERSRRLGQYGLSSPATERSRSLGLADARWFRATVPRARMKALMRREDGPAIRSTALWLGLMLVAGVGVVLSWGTWLVLPCLLVFGVLYGSASDARWHETLHGTAFESRRMNTTIYQIACFMMMKDPTAWRWSHTRHHTDTIIVGMDPEIAAMRPARLVRICANFFGLYDVPAAFRLMFVHSLGRLTPDESVVIPEREATKVYRMARIWLGIYAVVLAASVVWWSWLPILLVGGPRIYGSYMMMLYGLTQHAGLQENVLDHRLNCRTVRMCWVNRFLYWNMNYHLEHHMFPMVPTHRLPDLHKQIERDLPAVYPSIWAAYKELVPAILRQLNDPTYGVRRELPAGATPYYEPITVPADYLRA